MKVRKLNMATKRRKAKKYPLAACPFCDSEENLQIEYGFAESHQVADNGTSIPGVKYSAYVRCITCGARGPIVVTFIPKAATADTKHTLMDKTELKSADLWTNRLY